MFDFDYGELQIKNMLALGHRVMDMLAAGQVLALARRAAKYRPPIESARHVLENRHCLA